MAAAAEAAGDAHSARREFAAAVECYTAALAASSSPAPLLSSRSSALLQLGLPAWALADAQACIAAQPGGCRGYSRLAAALLAVGHAERAAAQAQRGLALAAGEPKVQALLAEQLQQAQRDWALGAAEAQHLVCAACSQLLEREGAFRCYQCSAAVYCGRACQAAHWATTHRAACRRLQDLTPRPHPPLLTWQPLAVRRVAPAQAAGPHTCAPGSDAETDAVRMCLGMLERGATCTEELPMLLALGSAARSAVLAGAAYWGSEGLAASLLAAGADPNSYPSLLYRAMHECQLHPALHNAVQSLQVGVLQALLQGGGDPNQPLQSLTLPLSQRPFTPLLACCATTFGCGDGRDTARLRCAVLLLRAGARLEATDHLGYTPLLHCCRLGDAALPMARLLLRAGADADALDHRHPYPWHCMDVAMLQHPRVQLGLLRALLGAGASVAPRRVPERSPESCKSHVGYLCALATSSDSSNYCLALRLLLQAGASPSAVLLPAQWLAGSVSQPPPLAMAVFQGATAPALQALLAAGAHPDAPCVVQWGRPPSLRRPMLLALDCPGGGSASAVQLLLQAGASTAGMDLCWPSRACSEEVVRLLQRAEVSVHARGACKTNPLMHALIRGDTGVIQALLDGGAVLEQGFSCLGFLAESHSLQAGAVTLLLKHETTKKIAKMELKDKGRCLLHVAASKGNGAGVLELLEAGADAREMDKMGVLALAHLKAAAGKRRNEGQGRGEEYRWALEALTAATGKAVGRTPRGSDSEGEEYQAE